MPITKQPTLSLQNPEPSPALSGIPAHSGWEVKIVQNGFVIRPLLRPDCDYALIALKPSDLSDIFEQLATRLKINEERNA